MKTYTIYPLILATLIFASCSNYYVRKGDKTYEAMAYQNAITYYEKYLSKKSSNDVKIKLANSYRLTNNLTVAEKLYSEVVTFPESKPIDMFYYGKILMSGGKYKDAVNWFEKYLTVEKDDFVAECMLSSCKSIDKFKQDTLAYAIVKAKMPDVNSAFGQVKYGDGIVFSADKTIKNSANESGWTGRSYLDLYYSKKDTSGNWVNPQALKGEINGAFHEGPATFNKTQNVVYFTRSNYSKKHKLKKSSMNENNLKIFRAELINDKWTDLEMLPFNSDEYSCGHPALSADGKVLYFISDMPGGLGGTDIYRVTVDSSQYSTPINLGPQVNTPGNEMFPFVHPDGTLYFSSDSRDNMGGLDVFETTCSRTTCLTSENMNYPINTTKDDFAITFNDDKKSGFLSSNRDSLDAIYEVKKMEPTFTLQGRVYLKENKDPVADAIIELLNTETNTKEILKTSGKGDYIIKLKPGSKYRVTSAKEGFINETAAINILTAGKKKTEMFTADFMLDEVPTAMLSGKIFLKGTNELIDGATVELVNTETKKKEILTSGVDGKYKIKLEYKKKYLVKSFKEGYFTITTPISISAISAKKNETFTADFMLDKIEMEKAFVLDNIYYDLGKWNIKPNAAKELDRFVTFLNQNPKINVEVSSHTDSRAKDQFNLTLSQKRAKSVVDYLISKGIDPKRMESKGYGETKLLNTCGNGVKCTEEQHQQNRRTEFKVLKINK